MVSASDALPATAKYREIMLSDQHVFGLASQTVSEVGVVDVAVVHSKAFPRESNRPMSVGINNPEYPERMEAPYLEYSRSPDSSSTKGSESADIIIFKGSPYTSIVY